VDERHGGPLPGQGGAGHGRAEVVDQLADGRFGLLVAGLAGAGGGELAEQPQQQERLVRDAHLADAGLPEMGQPGQQFVAGHQSRLSRLGAFRTEHVESGPGAATMARSA
jgi:hypothetical protein